MQHSQGRKENDMAKARSKSKPKSFVEVSRESTKAAMESRQRRRKNRTQGNIQKSARVAKQKQTAATKSAMKRIKNKGTAI